MPSDLVLYINNIFIREDNIKDNTLYNNILIFSGLTKSPICREKNCYGTTCSILYSFFVQFILLMGNINILLFNFTLNPYDISVFIYYLFFLGFFIYARYFYNIEDHYKDLMNISTIKNNTSNKKYVKCIIRFITVLLCTITLFYWSLDTYYVFSNKKFISLRGNRVDSYYKPDDIFDVNIYNYLYKPIIRLTNLYIYMHIICYIVNITFVFTIHKYELKEFNINLKENHTSTDIILDDFTKIRINVKNSVKKIGHLMNLGISCVVFKLPLEILDIIKEQNFIIVIPFIINSICFLYGIYQAACINNYNKKFVRAFYQNTNIRNNKDNVDYLLNFFSNNKIFFKVMGTSPTTETLVKIILIVVNIGISIISGIISNKIL